MRVAVALSGGVDSAVAAYLLKAAGHDVIGVTMSLWRDGRYKGGPREACFGPDEKEDIKAAGELAERLAIPLRVVDLSDAYERLVLEHFRRERLAGRTPNPCVVCNAKLKFGLLPECAARLDGSFARFATGHYARLVRSNERLAVAQAADRRKDQSYFLWRLTQPQLEKIVFPLGWLDKLEVRQIARQAGLPMAEKSDSQDFYSGNPNELLGAPDAPGAILSADGKILGTHHGYWHYTIGQRHGLGLSGGVEPWYVLDILPETNQVIVGRQGDLRISRFRIGEINWQGMAKPTGPVDCYVKIRSSGTPLGPAVFDGGVIESSSGFWGVAPGQSAVVYSDQGVVLCGGIIEKE